MRWHVCTRRPRAAAHVGPSSSCVARTAAGVDRPLAAGRCHSLAMAAVLLLQRCSAAAETSAVARACSGDRQRRWAACCSRHRPGLFLRQQSDPLHSKRLYITDLAQRLEALERGHQAHPVATGCLRAACSRPWPATPRRCCLPNSAAGFLRWCMRYHSGILKPTGHSAAALPRGRNARQGGCFASSAARRAAEATVPSRSAARMAIAWIRLPTLALHVDRV